MTTTRVLRVLRTIDLRPADWGTGKRLAATTADTTDCQVCGKRGLVRVSQMENGMLVGSECAGYLSLPVYRIGRTNAKCDAVLAALDA